MSTATDIDVDLDLTTDGRPECDAKECPNEAVWHYVWEKPCGCPWQVCDPHRKSAVLSGWGIYICGDCGAEMGCFIGWERV